MRKSVQAILFFLILLAPIVGQADIDDSTAWSYGEKYVASSSIENPQKNWLGYWDAFDILMQDYDTAQSCTIHCKSTALTIAAQTFSCTPQWSGKCELRRYLEISCKPFELSHELIFHTRSLRTIVNRAIKKNITPQLH